ncbi:MAG: ABC transporter substrate-binding protein [Bacteroidia bacterium]|nr:ABC transporter substrate-binding protein [Bacteroidia bacterium]
MKFPVISVLATLIILFESCGGIKESHPGTSITDNGALISSAERFTLQKNDSCTIVTIINPWQGANDVTQVYYLVSRGSELPDGLDSSMVIFVPLKRIVCMSTTHIAMISALGEENTIAGVSGTGFIFSGSLIRNVEKGLIEDVGYETNLNKELILKISPDLIMMYGIGSESAGYVGKIKELGVKVVFNADYLETDPLSKAEWIKLFGALYCKENLADSIYKSEVEAYNKMKSYISRNISGRPKVLLGLPFKDTWYVSPGNSFISKLIRDAGGSYLWQNTESSVSMPFGIENVYLSALTADYWLNIGSVNTKDEISMIDQRLEGLPCFKNGNLYNNNKRITANGGNDYWESGSLFPHVILKDIASILHPELFIDNELFYYHKIY